MDITLYDLLDAYEFADLEDTFARLYPKNFNRNVIGFEKAFEELKEFDDTVFSEYVIDIEEVADRCRPVGILEDKSESVSLCFTPWQEWLGMKVHPIAIKSYDNKEIVCHCLWEMTFFGYNEKDIKSAFEEFEDSLFEVKNAEAMLDEISDLENEAESKRILMDMLKDEIESSSSSEYY